MSINNVKFSHNDNSKFSKDTQESKSSELTTAFKILTKSLKFLAESISSNSSRTLQNFKESNLSENAKGFIASGLANPLRPLQNPKTMQNVTNDQLIENILLKKKAPNKKEEKNICSEIEKSKNLIEALQTIEKKEYKLNPFILCALFKKEGCFEIKKRLFEKSDQKSFDSYVIAEFIELADKNGDFESAKKAFNSERNKHIITDVICGVYITAACNNRNSEEAFGEARKAFEIAKNRNILSDITCACYIKRVGKENFSEASRAFNIWKQKKGVNREVYSVFIDLLLSNSSISNKNFNKANEYFDELEKNGFFENVLVKGRNRNVLDLHFLSKGTALLASIRFIKNKNRRTPPTYLICGQGHHSKRFDNNGISPIKSFLLEKLPLYCKNKNISVSNDNPGCIVVQ